MAGKPLRTRQSTRHNKFIPYNKYYDQTSYPNTTQKDDNHHNNHSYLDHREKNSSPIIKKSYTGWYKIFIPNIKNYNEVLKIILAYVAPVVFYPYNKKYIDNNLTFLVDDYKIANILYNTNYKLILKDNNQRLIIKVYYYSPSHSSISFIPVSDKVKEKIREAVITRYNPVTKYLDLSQFHTCPLFTENHLFVSLNRPAVFLATLNIITKYIRYNLYSLNLENNNIYLKEGIVFIRRLFPELKVLNLSNNLLTDFKHLWSLKGFSIEVLNLSGNPICIMNDNEFYRLSIQKIFPMLKKLDNLELPFRYSNFIIDSKLKMPINLGNSYPIPNNHDPEEPNPIIILVESFLKQYYEHYDNVSKQKIKDAYCKDAIFSMSADYLSNKSKSKNNMVEYSKYSRNFLKSDQDEYMKNNLVYKGRENIINFLDKLPKVKHDFGSFVIDVPFANSAIIQIMVNGVFIEVNEEKIFQSFCRLFCLVPIEEGWCILNDMLFVTLVSDELLVESSKRFYIFNPEPEKLIMNDHNSNNITKYRDADNVLNPKLPLCQQFPNLSKHQKIIEKEQKNESVGAISFLSTNKLFPTVNIKPTVTVHPAIKVTDISIPIEPTNSTKNTSINSDTKMRMIKQFSIESGMNVEWSKKCLEDNNWNYEKSSLCFIKLKSRIPSTAYIHNLD